MPYTRRVVFLEDGETRADEPSGVQTFRNDGGTSDPDVKTLEEAWADAERGDFPHFMLKEFMNNPMRFGTASPDAWSRRKGQPDWAGSG